MLTDPIADMLTRIRNAVAKRHEIVEIPSSKMKKSIADILKNEGFIRSWREEEHKGQGKIIVEIAYKDSKHVPIYGLKRVSRPGRRRYVGYADLKPLLNGAGVAVLSTPQGVVTDTDAREKKIGGELLLTVW